jgi:hypothetical protein
MFCYLIVTIWRLFLIYLVVYYFHQRRKFLHIIFIFLFYVLGFHKDGKIFCNLIIYRHYYYHHNCQMIHTMLFLRFFFMIRDLFRFFCCPFYRTFTIINIGLFLFCCLVRFVFLFDWHHRCFIFARFATFIRTVL